MYELKHRLTPEVAGKTIAEVARHSVGKPNRPTHYYELRSAIFKVVSNEELSSVERGILNDEMVERFPLTIHSVYQYGRLLHENDVDGGYDPDFDYPDVDVG